MSRGDQRNRREFYCHFSTGCNRDKTYILRKGQFDISTLTTSSYNDATHAAMKSLEAARRFDAIRIILDFSIKEI